MTFQNNVDEFIHELKYFIYRTESVDHIWDIIFPDYRQKYHHIRVTKYHEVFYIIAIDSDLCTLEVKPKQSVTVESSFGLTSRRTGNDDPSAAWDTLITYARK